MNSLWHIWRKPPRIQTDIENLNFYGSITWTYHNDLLGMQRFYEEVLGFSTRRRSGMDQDL